MVRKFNELQTNTLLGSLLLFYYIDIFLGLFIKNQNERLQHIVSENQKLNQHDFFQSTPLQDLAEKRIHVEMNIKYMFSDSFFYGFQI